MNEPARTGRAWLLAVADAATLGAAGLALLLFLLGSWRFVFGTQPVTITASHALFAATALGALRHLFDSSPSLWGVVRRWSRALGDRPDLSEALLVFWLTRPTVLAVGLLAGATFGVLPSADQPPSERHLLRDLPARFDANWYAGIADYGYDWQGRFDRQQNVAFFPAFPLLMRAAGPLTGAFDPRLPPERRLTRLAWAGLGVSLVAFIGAAWYFARLARDLLGPDRVRPALLLLACYPFAAYFSAAYTESVFLLAALGTWFHFRRGELARAGAWGLLLGLTRPNGFFLAVPLGLIALGLRDAPSAGSRSPGGMAEEARPGPWLSRSRIARAVVAGMPVCGMLLFTLWLHDKTGEWFTWARIQEAWGRFAGTGEPAFSTGALASHGLLGVVLAHPYKALNALGLLFALVLIGPVWRRLGAAWAAYVVVSVGPPLLAGGVLSMGRLTSTLFPLFLALAAVLPPRFVPLAAAAFALLQGLVAALFYTWREMY